MSSFEQKVEGGILGLLVGDALGVPYEFKSPHEIPRDEGIEFEPPPGYPRSHASVSPGTWSDDGAQALCLLESLLACGKLDPDDFARRMVNWYEWGHLAVDGNVFDVGIQTSAALRAIRAGTPPMSAASRDASANGNGSLMRVLPLAVWSRGTDAELVRDARLSSQVTHAHPRAQLCCALYCLWVRRMLADSPDSWADAVTTLREIIAGNDADRSELEIHIGPDLEPVRAGSGYVVDTLRSARVLAQQGDYTKVVKAAVRLGYDTDTTAAVVGGAVGARDGVSTIPLHWREALRGRDLLQPLLDRLLNG